MQVADVVCAIVGSPASGGVAVELGWASALAKPVVVVKTPGASCSPLIDGLNAITPAVTVADRGTWDDEFFAELVMRMGEVLDAEHVLSPHGGVEAAFVGLAQEASHT
jgi:hypothetical protein